MAPLLFVVLQQQVLVALPQAATYWLVHAELN
jgi:hypothetical protein